MITDLSKIADEWSYRVGTIKPKDFKHLYHLNQILYEYGWSYEVIEGLTEKGGPLCRKKTLKKFKIL